MINREGSRGVVHIQKSDMVSCFEQIIASLSKIIAHVTVTNLYFLKDFLSLPARHEGLSMGGVRVGEYHVSSTRSNETRGPGKMFSTARVC